MLHRSHLQAMLDKYGLPQPWFADEVWHGEVYGEDLAFCERTTEMGVPVYVDVNAAVGHVKPICITKGMFTMGRKVEPILREIDDEEAA